MRLLGNILWHIPFLGFLVSAVTYVAGLLLTLTVVAAPIGLGLMQYARFLLAPFTRAMVSKSDLRSPEQHPGWKTYSTIVMIIYVPTLGLLLGAITLFQTVVYALTIIGIPMAIVSAKSLRTVFNPVNKQCVQGAVVDEIQRRKAVTALDG